jgi:hypothetical protein
MFFPMRRDADGAPSEDNKTKPPSKLLRNHDVTYLAKSISVDIALVN